MLRGLLPEVQGSIAVRDRGDTLHEVVAIGLQPNGGRPLAPNRFLQFLKPVRVLPGSYIDPLELGSAYWESERKADCSKHA